MQMMEMMAITALKNAVNSIPENKRLDSKIQEWNNDNEFLQLYFLYIFISILIFFCIKNIFQTIIHNSSLILLWQGNISFFSTLYLYLKGFNFLCLIVVDFYKTFLLESQLFQNGKSLKKISISLKYFAWLIDILWRVSIAVII